MYDNIIIKGHVHVHTLAIKIEKNNKSCLEVFTITTLIQPLFYVVHLLYMYMVIPRICKIDKKRKSYVKVRRCLYMYIHEHVCTDAGVQLRYNLRSTIQ